MVSAQVLRCPHCLAAGRDDEPLARHGASWRCAHGHGFDVARQGYVNLTTRPRHRGDTAAMLEARAAVHEAGHLDAVTAALVDACRDLPAGPLVEVGAGTAHHLAVVCRALAARTPPDHTPGAESPNRGPDAPPRDGVALDASVAAARRAARADGPITSVVADAWEPWPLLTGSVAAVLSVFAPRHPAEAARVLAAGGLLVTATPEPDHLTELLAPLGLLDVPADKAGRLTTELADTFLPVDDRVVRETREVGRADARALAAMGPAGHHLTADELDRRAARLGSRIPVTIAVRVGSWRPAGSEHQRPQTPEQQRPPISGRQRP
jgi:23S rRNA (guanine745-N1)-methyltransferase